MNNFDPYIVIIFGGLMVALSYLFDIISRKSRIPSVIFLLTTGQIIKLFTKNYGIDFTQDFFSILELLGIVGLITIVLEAAMDLKISRDKRYIISKSLLLAAVVLILSSLGIALAIMNLRGETFINSLVYAIPMSVVSSAVLIPSVHTLTAAKKEFMIYESTFSDIIGIMFFNFVILQSGVLFSTDGLWMIFLTILVSFVLSYILVYSFSKIKTHIKLFLMLAFLALLYAIGKKLHLSSLLIIFIFGLVLNNSQSFFRYKLKNIIDLNEVSSITKDFKIITAETAFVVRTFFFVAFGMSINLEVFTDPSVLLVGTVIVVILYIIRYLNFKIFLKTEIFPEIFLAPRGLITILLFFSIPVHYQIKNFSVGILSFVIIVTSLVMTIALLLTPKTRPEEIEIIDLGHYEISDFDQNSPEGPYCEVEYDNTEKIDNGEKN